MIASSSSAVSCPLAVPAAGRVCPGLSEAMMGGSLRLRRFILCSGSVDM